MSLRPRLLRLDHGKQPRAAPDAAEKWFKGQVSTETRGARYWVIASDKGKDVVRLSNAQLEVKDEVLQLDGFVKVEERNYQSERWLVVFDKAHAK